MNEITQLFKGHPRRFHGECQRCGREDYLPWATEQGVRYCGHCWEQDALSYAALRADGHPIMKEAAAFMCRDGHTQIWHNDSSLGEMCPVCLVKAENEHLLALVERLHVIAKNVSHALMSFTPGGSEYFTRVKLGDWEDYYADADVCQQRVRERIDKAEEGVRDQYRTVRRLQADLADKAVDVDILQVALEIIAKDPPATLDEPDTDAEVIFKMRALASRALHAFSQHNHADPK